MSSQYVTIIWKGFINMKKKELISQVLKEYRKRNNITVKQAVSFLHSNSVNIAEKTFYGWENAQALPDADTLMLLCDYYNINDMLGVFGYREQKTLTITKQEERLITQYREHPEFQRAILKLLDMPPIDASYFEQKK